MMMKGQEDGELNFGVGDVIEIIKDYNDGWCYGNFSKKTGMFPTSYVDT